MHQERTVDKTNSINLSKSSRDNVFQLLCGPSLNLKAYFLEVNVVKSLISELWMEGKHQIFRGKLVYALTASFLLVWSPPYGVLFLKVAKGFPFKILIVAGRVSLFLFNSFTFAFASLLLRVYCCFVNFKSFSSFFSLYLLFWSNDLLFS